MCSKSISALCFVIAVTLSKADLSGIYGLSGFSYTSEECSLLRFDVLTRGGNFSVVQVPGIDNMDWFGLSCLDAVHNIYFFMYQTTSNATSRLYGYNLADPSVTYNEAILPIDPWVSGDALACDPNTGDLFVFGQDANSDANHQLLLRVSFDPTTKKSTITQIGEYLHVNQFPVASALAVYDSKRKKLWFEAQENGYGNKYYVYIDAETGEIENEIAVKKDENIQTAVYNPKLDTIVTLNAVESNTKQYSSFQLIYVDAVTLKVTKRFDAFKLHADCKLGEGYTQDVDDAVNYAVILCAKGNDAYIGYLVGVNVDTGAVGYVLQFMEGEADYAPLDVQYWTHSN